MNLTEKLKRLMDKEDNMFSVKNTEILQDFDEFLTNAGYSWRTVSSYKNTLSHLFLFCGRDYNKITTRDVERFKTAYRKGKFSRSAVRKARAEKNGFKITGMSRQISALRAFFELFLEKQDVVKKVKLRFGKVLFAERVHSKADIRKLFKACENCFEWLCVGLGYYWGLRVSEVIELSRNDIDFKTGEVKVLGKGNKKVKQVMLPLPFKYAKELIRSQNYVSGIPNLLLYEAKSGFKPLYLHKLERILHSLCIKASVSFQGYHALRHSIATHLIEGGWTLREVQNYLRHTDVKTTTKYVHEEEKAVKEKGFKL